MDEEAGAGEQPVAERDLGGGRAGSGKGGERPTPPLVKAGGASSRVVRKF
jgi:hypothetical protein